MAREALGIILCLIVLVELVEGQRSSLLDARLRVGKTSATKTGKTGKTGSTKNNPFARINMNLCKYPPSPMNGGIKCRNSSKEIYCIGTCNERYRFPDGSESIKLNCYPDGQWEPLDKFPDCELNPMFRIDLSLCQYPPAPSNGEMRCRNSSDEIYCIGTCNKGFRLPDGSESVTLDCKPDGQWYPYVTFPDCEPICDPPCQNGGTCVGDNRCLCSEGFWGENCGTSISVCDTTGKFNGGVDCSYSSVLMECTFKCPRNQVLEPEIEIPYTCDPSGTWNHPTFPRCITVIPTVNLHKPEMMIKERKDETATGRCFTWNQNHFKTFDGLMYEFEGSCTYLLAKECTNNLFAIHMQMDHYCRPTCTPKLFFYFGSNKYTLETYNSQYQLLWNSNSMKIPGIVNDLVVEQIADHLIVKSSLGFTVIWDGSDNVVVEVNQNLRNNTCGLCGRFDGIESNDLENSNGERSSNELSFVDSWKMDSLEDSCPNAAYFVNSCPDPTLTLVDTESRTFCRNILSKVSSCRMVLDPLKFIEACVQEQCNCRKASPQVECKKIACSSITAYFQECLRLGVTLSGSWRTATECPKLCPPGMEYKDCGSSCPHTCQNPSRECVEEFCVGGCFCAEGLLYYNNTCYQQAQCPCLFQGREYNSGSMVHQDCNNCMCMNGKWECTKEKCEARCSSIGDPHYTTFDGKHYDFMGTCSYYLLYHSNYSVEQENYACNGDQSLDSHFYHQLPNAHSSCIRSIIIRSHGSELRLKQGFEITLNGHEVTQLPTSAPGLYVYMASSMFVKVELSDGLIVLWDGVKRLYLDAPPALIGQTRGLCGTYTLTQKDDFLTPEGDVEVDINSFASKWKAEPSCNELSTLGSLPDPCLAHPEHVDEAKRLCGIIKSTLFSNCHELVDPEVYYDDCMYDMCSCNSDVNNCLCPSIANFAALCSKKGSNVDWRAQVKQCSVTCTGGQIYSPCSSSCQHSCLDIANNPNCPEICVEGCNCPSGLTLNSKGECIPINLCTCLHNNKEYPAGYVHIEEKQACECINARWQCREARKDEIEIAPPKLPSQPLCPDTDNMEFTDCESDCPHTCSNVKNVPSCTTAICKPGCRCKRGYILDAKSKRCVKPEHCPCHHGDRTYAEGEMMRENCNLCVCSSGHWSCDKKECAGICTVWGDTHVSTFDGRIYDFKGDCEYTILRADTGNNLMTINVQNMPCGASGVACFKEVAISLGDEQLILSKEKPLPSLFKEYKESQYIVREVGLFVVVHTNIGITVYWDKGTQVHVRVNSVWKGNVQGLCGDYNGNEMDDFQTPLGGPTVAHPYLFADSWKAHDSCVASQPYGDNCASHIQRRNWAISRCNVLHSDIFKPCHFVVPVQPYYERCINDACGCDSGGDCECLCTAIATYAQECNIQKIPIHWRSQDLCPIQCETCDKYDPCISVCPKLTCHTEYLYKDLEKVCQEEMCVEGCDRPPCSVNEIFNNDHELKCIPLETCITQPCKIINGRMYLEGQTISDLTIAIPGQSCHCIQGNISCKGPSTAPPPPPTTISTIQPITPVCLQSGFSQWINSYQPLPDQDDGDYEILDLLIKEGRYNLCPKENIVSIICRSARTQQMAQDTGQIVHCSLPTGLICKNSDQLPNEVCDDYEISVYCDCVPPSTKEPPPPPPPVECTAPGWTYWMNSGSPSTAGESETLVSLREKNIFCETSQIENIECREVRTKIPHKDALNFGQSCTTDQGYVCLHSQTMTCPDVEVRFYCQCDKDCDYPRGMEKGFISDEQISESSSLSKLTTGKAARLHSDGAWSPAALTTSEWLQIDLEEIQEVSGITTQGNPKAAEWVTFYKIDYSQDGQHWKTVKDINNEELFFGNVDGTTPHTNSFKEVTARYIKIIPKEWINWISMRIELLGCNRYVTPVPTTVAVPITNATLSTEFMKSTLSTVVTPRVTLPPVIPTKILIPFICENDGWTEWMNMDSPLNDQIFEKQQRIQGDYELFYELHYFYPFCEDPTAIKCRTVDTKELASTTDQDVNCNINTGLICNNEDQTNGLCRDYEISVYCQCKKLPCIDPGYTPWFNSDHPDNLVKADISKQHDDLETFVNLRDHFEFCKQEYLVNISCRDANSHKDVTQGEPGITCDIHTGLICDHTLRPSGKCEDYEVQFYCLCLSEVEPKPPSGVKPITIPTTLVTFGQVCDKWTLFINNDDPYDSDEHEEFGNFEIINCSLPTKFECVEVGTDIPWNEFDVDYVTTCGPEGIHCIGDECPDLQIRAFCACPTTSPIPTTQQPVCISGWTDWFDIDNPESGGGDFELIESLRENFPICAKDKIIDIDCKAKTVYFIEGEKEINEEEKSDGNPLITDEQVKCDKDVGLECFNSLQPPGKICQDYEIRLYCDCEGLIHTTVSVPRTIPTTIPTAVPTGPTTGPPLVTTPPAMVITPICNQWTDWYNEGTPNDDGEEMELFATIPNFSKLCPIISQVECAELYSEEPYTSFIPQPICDKDGLVCTADCLDFKIRAFCQCEGVTTTKAPEIPCKEGWTDWFDTDNPDVGGGDFEPVDELRKQYKFCGFDEITNVECGVRNDLGEVIVGTSSDVFVKCNKFIGLACYNENQENNKQCEDYSIRFYCSCGPTSPYHVTTPTISPIIPYRVAFSTVPPVPPTRGTTPSVVLPSRKTTPELYPPSTTSPYPKTRPTVPSAPPETTLRPVPSVSPRRRVTTPSSTSPYPATTPPVSSRIPPSPYPITSSTVPPSRGATPTVVLPSQTISEIYTSIPSSVMTETTVGTSPTVVLPTRKTTPELYTTSPCPPGYEWNNCAYDCNNLCNAFLQESQQRGYCTVELGNCIPGCTNEVCNVPKYWRDESTCVDEDECTCLLEDGTVIPPLSVKKTGCTMCQCKNNTLECSEQPGCRTTETGIPHILTEIPGTTPLHRVTIMKEDCWTEWINTDLPESGLGDFERVSVIRQKYDFCENPIKIECRDSASKTNYEASNQDLQCDVDNGLICQNNRNGKDGCLDYEIRFYCPCVSTSVLPPIPSTRIPPVTLPAVCEQGLTDWFSAHVPDEIGEYEHVSNIREHHSFCSNENITAIYCREKSTGISYDQSDDRGTICTLQEGFICRNSEQANGKSCSDYEIQFLCDCGVSVLPSSISPATSAKTSVPTIPPSATSPAAASPATSAKTSVPTIPPSATSPAAASPATSAKTSVPTIPPSATSPAAASPATSAKTSVPTIPPSATSPTAASPATSAKTSVPTIPPSVTVSMRITFPTTGPTVVPGVCNYWSEWINEDQPTSGDGDKEYRSESDLNKNNKFCLEKSITDIQCLTADSKISYNNSGDNSVICNVKDGLHCENNRQTSGKCQDYMIRYYCSCEFPTTEIITFTPSTGVPVIISPCEGEFISLLKDLPDSNLKASSSISSLNGPQSARLNSKVTDETGGAWTAEIKDKNQFLQIDLGHIQPVYGIITQGHDTKQEWVKDYTVSYSRDGQVYVQYTNADGTVKVFGGNYNNRDHRKHIFQNAFEARFIRIQPKDYQRQISLRVDLLGCSIPQSTTAVGITLFAEILSTTAVPVICNEPMGFENMKLSDDQITVSSSKGDFYSSTRIRLNTKEVSTETAKEKGIPSGSGGWIAGKPNDKQFVQIDFTGPRTITGIVTQGRDLRDQWVKTYKIKYSNDGENWNDVTDKNGETVIFEGNSDSDTPVTNYFEKSVRARYIKLIPLDWNQWIAMRLEVKGCYEPYEVPTTSGPTEYTTEAVTRKTTPRVTLPTLPTEFILNYTGSTPRVPTTLKYLCLDEMGLENGKISDDMITVSSTRYQSNSDGSNVRLNTEASEDSEGGWVAEHEDQNQFVQIDFRKSVNLTGILTQGRDNHNEWVKKFSVLYSDDGENWNDALNVNEDKEFEGNMDSSTPKINMFKYPFDARYLKIVPLEWNNWISMRLEIIGCFVPEVPTPSGPTEYTTEAVTRKPTPRITLPTLPTEFILNYTGSTPRVPTTLKYLCLDEMGLENGKISDDMITVSSTRYQSSSDGSKVRLNTEASEDSEGGWVAEHEDQNQFVQIDFRKSVNLTGILTQGRDNHDEWVTKFSVLYSDDGENWNDALNVNEDKEFEGNMDSSTPKINMFKYPFEARYLKIVPLEWNNWISMRLEIIGCFVPEVPTPSGPTEYTTEAVTRKPTPRITLPTLPTEFILNYTGSTPRVPTTLKYLCLDEMGLENGKISDDMITVSSTRYQSNSDGSKVRLNTEASEDSEGGWVAEHEDQNQFVQIDFRKSVNLTGILTQGRDNHDEWVTKFSVLYSDDGENWNDALNVNEDKEFEGNMDSSTPKINMFKYPFEARYLKIVPLEWNNWISMRLEIIGCFVPEVPTPSGPTEYTTEAVTRKPTPRITLPTLPTEFILNYTGSTPRVPTTLKYLCLDEMGLENGKISDDMITVSSTRYQSNSDGSKVRLNTEASEDSEGGWVAEHEDQNQFVQIDFRKSVNLTGILTQGRDNHDEWVTKFSVLYSDDGENWNDALNVNEDKEFEGNMDSSTPKINMFKYPFEARYLKIVPLEWNNWISMRLEIIGCFVPEVPTPSGPTEYTTEAVTRKPTPRITLPTLPTEFILNYTGSTPRVPTTLKYLCLDEMGLENGKISDDMITVSSTRYQSSSDGSKVRLNTEASEDSEGGWVAEHEDQNQFVQIDFRKSVNLTGILTQGRDNHDEWVTKFSVLYSDDGENWNDALNVNEDKEFEGNMDSSTPKINMFKYPFEAHYLKIVPLEWNNWISMRLEIIGCFVPEVPTPSGPTEYTTEAVTRKPTPRITLPTLPTEFILNYTGSTPRVPTTLKYLCLDEMGLENGKISDDMITVSSTRYQSNSDGSKVRLNTEASEDSEGGWVAEHEDQNQFVQIDFRKSVNLTGILTQGRDNHDEWVTKFSVLYSDDGENWNDALNVNEDKEFEGNMDSSTPKINMFKYPFEARYLKIVPLEWNNWISMRLEIIGCFVPEVPTPSGPTEYTTEAVTRKPTPRITLPTLPTEFILNYTGSTPRVPTTLKYLCLDEMGLENGKISDDMITVSSTRYQSNSDGSKVRLNTEASEDSEGGWVAEHEDQNQFVQIDFRKSVNLTGILTQGRDNHDEWVTKFSVLYSDDGENWNDALNVNEDKEFEGNMDSSTPKINMFKYPFEARYLKIVPLEWNNWISMRLEIIGCFVPEVPTPSGPTEYTTEAVTRKPTPRITLPTLPTEFILNYTGSTPRVPTTLKYLCLDEMGLENGKISDDMITVSSTRYQSNSDGSKVRLNTEASEDSEGGWVAEHEDQNQFVQIDFRKSVNLTGILTQGRDNHDEWVTKFSVLYSDDGENWNDALNVNEDKEFEGNMDSSTPKINMFKYPFEARYLKIVPLEWNNWISMRLEIIGCFVPEVPTPSGPTEYTTEAVPRKHTPRITLPTLPTEFILNYTGSTPRVPTTLKWICKDPMGLENGLLKDSQIYVSSSLHGSRTGAPRIRLNTPEETDTGGWVAQHRNSRQYVQFDFRDNVKLTGIVTQGRNKHKEWVKTYKVKYSTDGIKWFDVLNKDGEKTFIGNFDENTPVTNQFEDMITARFLKILPVTWNNWISLRAEILGCFTPPTEIPPMRTTGKLSTVPTTSPTTTQVEECVIYGEWINLDRPSLSDGGDYEPIQEVISHSNMCSNPITVECREVMTHQKYSETGQTVSCDLEHGLDCQNGGETGIQCFDYEVRIGCYICGLENVTTPSPALPVCPEVPKQLVKNCPTSCPAYEMCDGEKCVPSMECACYAGGKKYSPGDRIETKDCHDCFCQMDGYSHCVLKTCPSCEEGKVSKLLNNCRCECEGCSEHERLCVTNGECIPEALWCDGVVDCPDDERFCVATTTGPPCPEVPIPTCTTGYYLYRSESDHGCPSYECVPVTEPRTQPPPPEIQICTMDVKNFKTFDGSEYTYETCHHILMQDKVQHNFNVTVHKDCPEFSNQCISYILIHQDSHKIKITDDLHVEYNSQKYKPNQLIILSQKTDDFSIRVVGNSVIFISKEYNFEVKTDIWLNVQIEVDAELLNQVNGLCGSYSQDPSDDFERKDGQITQNTDDFGDSWSIDSNMTCEPELCEDIERSALIYETCAALNMEPFDNCHPYINPLSYMAQCMSTMCHCLSNNKTMRECQCEVYTQYIVTCLKKNPAVNINEWRYIFGCAPKCPPGKEWKDCGSLCERTCDNLRENFSSCDTNECVAGCFCPPGFVKKDDQCIEKYKCEDCICNGYGDPHYYTFDRTYYPFQGNCTYVLSRYIDPKIENSFEVFATNEDCKEEPNTTCTVAVMVYYNGHLVHFRVNESVSIDGVQLYPSDFPFNMFGFNITSTNPPGRSIVIRVEAVHLEVRYFELNYGFEVRIPSDIYYDKTEGLCGNCNYDKSDDIKHKDGYLTNDTDEFALSWLAHPPEEMEDISDTCETKPKVECKNDTAKIKCGELLNDKFAPCHLLVDPHEYIQSCEFDVCHSDDKPDSLCRSLTEYARKCAEVGVCLENWRSDENCPATCPEGMHYEQCKSPCMVTCENKDSNILLSEECMIRSPVEGCVCNGNLVLKDGVCVEPFMCDTCDEEGHVIGDTWKPNSCVSCRCTPKLRVECLSAEICNPPPICNEDEKLITMAADNDTCCPVQFCIIVPPTCVEMDVPDCPEGEVARPVTDKDGCLKYNCECDVLHCKPISEPSKLDVGEIVALNKSGCCPVKEIVCMPETCPEKPKCNSPRKLVERASSENKCCPEFSCELEDKCSYPPNFILENGIQISDLNQPYELYEPGEKWKDGNCITCVCEGSPGNYEAECSFQGCPFINHLEKDYKLKEITIPYACCPEYKKVACRDDIGEVHEVGTTWSIPGDKCSFYQCLASGSFGEITKVKSKLQCDDQCLPNQKYVESPDSCCGRCEDVACLDETGHIHPVGDKWNDESLHCFELSCNKSERNGINIVLTHKHCPPFPYDCPEDKIKMDEEDCCTICTAPVELCQPEELNLTDTIKMFRVKHKGQICTNKKPIKKFTQCSGKCESHSVYSAGQNDYASTCSCCTPSESESREIELECTDKTTYPFTFQQPLSCSCTPCTGWEQTKLELPGQNQ